MNREERRKAARTKTKVSKKTPEQVRQETHGDIMDMIIAETFARHNDATEEEFLKAIGFEGSGLTEEEAVKVATFNLLMAITKGLLELEGRFNMATKLFKNIMLEEGMVEEEKGE